MEKINFRETLAKFNDAETKVCRPGEKKEKFNGDARLISQHELEGKKLLLDDGIERSRRRRRRDFR